MKNLQHYYEDATSNVVDLIKNAMSKADYSELQKFDQNNINRFDISSKNEEYICSLIEDNGVKSVKEYYFMINDKSYDEQSTYEKAKFGAEYGDIIFCQDDKFKDAVDIKIGENMFGAISLSSLKFFKGSTYLCINRTKKDYILLSVEKLREALKDDDFVSKYVGDNKYIKVQKLINSTKNYYLAA